VDIAIDSSDDIALGDAGTFSGSRRYRGMELAGNQAFAGMFADTLSWAVRRGIPLHEALKTLPFYKRMPVSASASVFVLSLIFRRRVIRFLGHYMPSLFALSWSARIRLLTKALNKGENLGPSLQRYFKSLLPDFYILGVTKAEAQRRLDIALPLLADQLNYPAGLSIKLQQEVTLVLTKIISSAGILIFLCMTIVPKFAMIFSDLSGASPAFALPFDLHTIAVALQWLGILVVILLVLPKLGAGGEYMLLRIPIAGTIMKRVRLADAARSMAAFTGLGCDITVAAEWSTEAARSHWIKGRLAVFLQKVRSGARWEDAWCSMEIDSPLDQWVIRSAASREDPVSGFELLAEWLHQDLYASVCRLERWIDPLTTIVTAILVGSIAYWMFSNLINIMYSLM
jgi:type II secretory pathway component PulF